MELHHSKHHQTYVNGFNSAAKELEQVSASLAPRHSYYPSLVSIPIDY